MDEWVLDWHSYFPVTGCISIELKAQFDEESLRDPLVDGHGTFLLFDGKFSDRKPVGHGRSNLSSQVSCESFSSPCRLAYELERFMTSLAIINNIYTVRWAEMKAETMIESVFIGGLRKGGRSMPFRLIAHAVA